MLLFGVSASQIIIAMQYCFIENKFCNKLSRVRRVSPTFRSLFVALVLSHIIHLHVNQK